MPPRLDKPRGAFLDRLTYLFLLIGGLLMLAVGVLFLARPTILTSGMGVIMDSAAARTEIRAVYGGFEVVGRKRPSVRGSRATPSSWEATTRQRGARTRGAE